MKVFVNSEPIYLENSEVLSKLLENIGWLHASGIAVAVNNIVISKEKWQMYNLKEEDKITIIKASQGG